MKILYASSIEEAYNKIPAPQPGELLECFKNGFAILKPKKGLMWASSLRVGYGGAAFNVICIVRVMTVEDWHNVDCSLEKTLNIDQFNYGKELKGYKNAVEK